MRHAWFGMLALTLNACGGATSAEPEPVPVSEAAPLRSCDATPRWVVNGGGAYGVRRGYLGFSPEGARLAWSSGYYSPMLREFDSQSGDQLSIVGTSLDGMPHNELVDRDRAWQRDLIGTFELYVASDGAAVGVHITPEYVAQESSSCAFFDESGARVFRPFCADGPSWQVQSSDDGKILAGVDLPGECRGLTSSQRAGDVLLTGDDTVAYWPAGALAPSARARHESQENERGMSGLVGVALNPARQSAISVALDGSVQLYRLPELSIESRALSARVTLANLNVYAPILFASPVSYSHDGTLLVLAGDPGLEVRDSATLQVLSTLPETDVIALAFAGDDSLLAVASEGRLAVYDCR